MRYYIILLILSVLFTRAVFASPASGSPVTRVRQEQLYFIENKGQLTDEHKKPRNDIHYKLNAGDGLNIFIANGAVYYQWMRPVAQSEDSTKVPDIELYQLSARLVGANPGAVKIQEEPYPHHENYYLPRFPDGITANSCRKIIYKDIYPNIDWVLYIREPGPGHVNALAVLKYDFVVYPGGDVKNIKLKYEGDTAITMQQGDITIHTPLGSVTEKAPYSYEQESKKTVKSEFKLADGEISIRTGKYNGTLVIDPTLIWRTYIGGEWGDYATSVARRDGLNVTSDITYVAGATQSWHHNRIVVHPANTKHQVLHAGDYNAGNGDYDGFLAAYTFQGRQQWATYYGGDENDVINSMVTDKYGNIYIAGSTKSDSGIATPGSYQPVASGTTFPLAAYYNDGFIAKFDTTGRRIWGTYFGGESWDMISAITLDSASNIYATGETYSFTGIATTGTHQTNMAGFKDAFVAKFDSSGKHRLWATYYGGYMGETGYALTCDFAGNVYATGTTGDDTCIRPFNPASATAIATPGSHQSLPANIVLGCPIPPGPPPAPVYDAFLVKFDAMTGVRKWGTYYGGNLNDVGQAIVFDSSKFVDPAGKLLDGLIYFGGSAESPNNIATPGGVLQSGGGFVAAFKTNGERYWGSYAATPVTAMCLDKNNSLVTNAGIFNQAVMIAGGVGGAGIVADHYKDASVNYIYTAGRALSKDLSVGASIEQPVYGDDWPYIYGDGILSKYEVSTPMWFRILAPPGPGIPPVKNPLRYLPAKTFGNFCTGLEYEAHHDIFYATDFPKDNYFTIQLSDSSGSFLNLMNIGGGADTGTSASNIRFTIPTGLPSGKKYRVRLVSSHPLAISREETVSVSVSPYISGFATSPLCPGETLVLTSSDTLTTEPVYYQWVNRDSSFISLSKDTFLANVTTADSGPYIVTSITGTSLTHGCYSMDTVNVVVRPNPAIIDVGNTGPVCEGSELKLFINADTTGGASFSWTGPGFSSADQNPAIKNPTVANTGFYHVRLTKYGCSSTDSTYVMVDSLPAMPLAGTNSPICYGDTLKIFAANVVPGIHYLWTGPGSYASTLPGNYILNGNETISGLYILKASNAKCTVYDSIRVLVKPPLAPPGISSNSPIEAGQELKLFVDGPAGASYQWSGPDSFMSNQQNPVIKYVPYSGTGQYRVAVTSDGCTTSGSIVVVVNTTSEVFFVLFPNPNDGNFTIRATLNNDQVVPLEVVNSVGQKIFEQKLVSTKRLLIAPVSLPGYLSNGDYYLRIRTDGGDKVIPFVISK